MKGILLIAGVFLLKIRHLPNQILKDFTGARLPKTMALQLFEQEGRLVLQGTWTSKNCAGSTGKVVLVKEVLF